MRSQSSALPEVLLWKRIYFLILIAGLLYIVGWLADTRLLASQEAVATVIGKEHLAMQQTYSTEKIGNVTRAIPRTIPEQFILQLRLAGRETKWPVEKSYFQSVEAGRQLHVRYEERRLTRTVRILSVEE